MKPFVALGALFAAASGAPTELLPAAGVGLAATGYGIAAPALATGYAAAPALATGYAAAPAVAVAAAPAVVPPPIVNEAIAGPDAISRSQAPATQTKQVHYGQTTYVSGYASEILKPAIAPLGIQVPTVLRRNIQVNPAIVKTVNEIHTVNEPNPVDAPYNVPYDVPVPVERIVEVPVKVAVDRPYAVDAPYAVQGEPIINVQEQNIHRHFHTQSASVAAPALAVAQPAVAAVGYAAAPGVAVAGHY